MRVLSLVMRLLANQGCWQSPKCPRAPASLSTSATCAAAAADADADLKPLVSQLQAACPVPACLAGPARTLW